MISNVYNYYLAEYAHKTNARYRSHDPEELRLHYSKMLKINSSMPFYKLDVSENAQKYAIDIKERATELSDIADDLSDITDNERMCFKKSAQSSDESIVSVKYVGSQEAKKASFDIEIQELACTQLNQGKFLPSDSDILSSGNYCFDLKISGVTYQFEIVTAPNEKMKAVQEKVARLINQSKIGITASCIENEKGSCAICLESEQTGRPESGLSNQTFFQIQDNEETGGKSQKYDTPGLISVLGLSKVVRYPENAYFSIDEKQMSSPNNSYLYKEAYELKFHALSRDSEPVTIRLKEDSDAIIESLSEFADKINQIMQLTMEEEHSIFYGNARLKNEMLYISRKNEDMLRANGLHLQENGQIEVKDSDIRDIVNRGLAEKLFMDLSAFKNDIKEHAEFMAIDPMRYVNNIIVSYPDPQKGFYSAYFVSLYSGMIFSGAI